MGNKLKALILGDICFAWLSFYLALYFRFGYLNASNELFSKPLFRVFFYISLLITASYIFDLYSYSRHRNNRDVLKKILQSACFAFLGLSALIYINPEWMIGRGLIAISLSLFMFFQFTWHKLFRIIFNLQYLTRNIIVVGTGELAYKISKMVESAEVDNHALIGFISCSTCKTLLRHVPEEKILGDMNQLLEIITRTSATELIITNPEHLENSFFQNLLFNSKLLGVGVSDVPTYFEHIMQKLMLENLDVKSFIYSTGFRRNTLLITSKRVVDVIISVIGLALTLPFFPLLVLLVKLNSSGPVFYRQVRVGHMGKYFTLYKFRTMGKDAELETGAVWSQENDSRIKPIGKFLRKSRLDELPQLFNVLLGNMSFVGPRPERPEFVTTLNDAIPFYSKRHFTKPGITGWAQIRHPYGSSVEDSFEKLRYDLYYSKHMNPLLDTMIFLKTIRVILFQFGGR